MDTPCHRANPQRRCVKEDAVRKQAGDSYLIGEKFTNALLRRPQAFTACRRSA